MNVNTMTKQNIVPYEQRKGMSICIISRGEIPSIWFQHMVEKVTKKIPSGIYWNYVIKIGSPEKTGDNYASLRNECVNEALSRGSKYVFFIDDDVFVPENTIGRMLELTQQGYKLLSGLYYKKTADVEPVIFKHLGDGPYYNYPVDQLFEIEGSGAGCMWIDTEIFDKMREKGIPYFKQDWVMQMDKDSKRKKGSIQVEIGEDHWLYYQAKKLGYTTYCHSGLICDHYNVRDGKTYPLSDEVYRVRNIDLKNKEEKTNGLELNKFREHKKPTIVFIVPTGVQINGNSLAEKPIGGSETAMIHTAKRLASDYNVALLTTTDKEGEYDGVSYISLSKFDLIHDWEIDLAVMYRSVNMVLDPEYKKRIKSKNYWFWAQDYPMYGGFENFIPMQDLVDKIIMVSNDHANALKARFPAMVKEEKLVVIENGVDSKLYEELKDIKRKDNQFYYASTPYRGLEVLLDCWPEIKKKLPDATLKVCSGMKVYNEAHNDAKYQKLYEQCRKLDGIEYMGCIKQNDLAKIEMESIAMLYPCIFAETNCIVVAESQTAGTPIICSDLGALKETVHDGCGIKIPGNPKNKEWKQQFIKEVISLAKDKAKWNKLHKECLKQNFDWSESELKWKKQLQPIKKEFQKVKVMEPLDNQYAETDLPVTNYTTGGPYTTTETLTNNLEPQLESNMPTLKKKI